MLFELQKRISGDELECLDSSKELEAETATIGLQDPDVEASEVR